MPSEPTSKRQRRCQLIEEMLSDLLGSRRFERMMREMVLRVLVEQEDLRRLGAVQAFFSECEAREIVVALREDGKLVFTNVNRLGPDLRAVLTLHRQDIIRHLEYQRELEFNRESKRRAALEKARQQPKEATNERPGNGKSGGDPQRRPEPAPGQKGSGNDPRR